MGNPPGVPALETYLPVRQTPAFVYSDSTVADICATLQQWDQENDPDKTGGCWAFWIDLHSSIDPSLLRPLLRLRHIVSSFPTALGPDGHPNSPTHGHLKLPHPGRAVLNP